MTGCFLKINYQEETMRRFASQNFVGSGAISLHAITLQMI